MTTLNTPPMPALNAPAAMQQLDQPFSALMASTSPQARAAVLRQEAPDLQSLFGSMDLCECEHCRSFYSPAAYLVDILHWLAQRPKKDRRSPKDVLFQRRPDLGDIELSCENTNTVIPYVDLVNEVLEDAIAPPPTFHPVQSDTLPKMICPHWSASLDTRDAPAVITAFGTDHPLSLQAVITVQQAGEWWTIAEPAYTYTIRKVQDGSNLCCAWSLAAGRPTERARSGAPSHSTGTNALTSDCARPPTRGACPSTCGRPKRAPTWSISARHARGWLRHSPRAWIGKSC